MEKKLTLNQTWKYCLEMWEWVAEQIKQGTDLDVDALKEKWLRKYTHIRSLYNDCFFCEYLKRHCTEGDCSTCPGKLVNKRFYCNNQTYHYDRKPLKFYQKLVKMNEKRLKDKDDKKQLK